MMELINFSICFLLGLVASVIFSLQVSRIIHPIFRPKNFLPFAGILGSSVLYCNDSLSDDWIIHIIFILTISWIFCSFYVSNHITQVTDEEIELFREEQQKYRRLLNHSLQAASLSQSQSQHRNSSVDYSGFLRNRMQNATTTTNNNNNNNNSNSNPSAQYSRPSADYSSYFRASSTSTAPATSLSHGTTSNLINVSGSSYSSNDNSTPTASTLLLDQRISTTNESTLNNNDRSEPPRLLNENGQEAENVFASFDCSICLEQYESRDMVRVLPCRHVFHPGCINEWLRGHHICPVCRAPVGTFGQLLHALFE